MALMKYDTMKEALFQQAYQADSQYKSDPESGVFLGARTATYMILMKCKLYDEYEDWKKQRQPKSCAACEYHDDFSWACSNGDSERCGDYTEPEYGCEGWEEKHNESISSV